MISIISRYQEPILLIIHGNRIQRVSLFTAIVMLGLSGMACNFLTSFKDSSVSEFSFINPDLAIITTDSGLQYQDEMIGEGRAAQAGDFVVMHYEGWLIDGTKFDSSFEGGYPIEYLLSMRSKIAGWDEGILGMRPGGVRLLIIPPELAYGARGTGAIPPNATLIFRVEVLAVAE